MALVFVQLLLLLLFTYVWCTTQDPESGILSIGDVRQIETRLKPTDVNNIDLFELRKVHFQAEVARSNRNGGKGTKRKRASTIFTYSMNISDTVNNLRSYAGASDMNYLTYSSALVNNAKNWTSYCDADATVYSTAAAYPLVGFSATPPDQVAVLATAFNTSDFYYGLRSVELLSNGAAYSLCPVLRYNGKNHSNIYLAVYLFSCTSAFNASLQQYTLGEPCTTCRSGRYWCYQGNLCSDDCSASDSNCYCNAYCLNCANTNSTTCMCQCLDGWTGLRCDNASAGDNFTTPTCTTTPRVPITWTTTTIAPKITTSPTTMALKTTTIPTTVLLKTTLNNVAPIGKPTIQLCLYAALVLFLRLFIN